MAKTIEIGHKYTAWLQQHMAHLEVMKDQDGEQPPLAQHSVRNAARGMGESEFKARDNSSARRVLGTLAHHDRAIAEGSREDWCIGRAASSDRQRSLRHPQHRVSKQPSW
jgi:hypothetical protein